MFCFFAALNYFTHHPYAGPSQPRNEQAAPTQQVPPPPQPSSPLDQFASYLKAVYGRQKFPSYEKWPPCSSKKYINLACIEKDKISAKKSDEFTKASIHGNIDDIVSEKHPMKFQQIAKKLDDGSWPKLILVEGAPGVGKSTFAWKLCRKWNKGKILNQYKLVVLLRLRDKRVREAKTLYDLIYYHDSKKRTLFVEKIDELNGKDTLLLFEGYDELPAQLQKDEESILMQILSGECLPKATVLVTSRHSASRFIVMCERISQHIEILGFTRENIQTYINENIKDSEERRGLERYLSFYPHIRTMMYVPLNSVIVVEVYHQCHDKNKPAPKTMTELYTSLVRTLLIRYLKYEVMLETFEHLKYYDKYKQFCQICKIAYDGIANNQQIIFYKSNIPDGFETLDLMQEVHELYVDKGDCVSYNFLHLTIQEYLAAVHLSMQSVSVQIQHFKEKEAESSFEMVLRFLSGLSKFHNYPQHSLAPILEPQSYRHGPIHVQQSRLNFQLNFHWLFEAQNVEYVSDVLKKDVFSVDDLSTPFEAYALGYCVAHSNLQWKLYQFTEDSTIMEMLVRGLLAEETLCKGTLYEVNININESTQEFFKPTILIRFFRKITCTVTCTALSFLSGVSTELVKDLTSCFDTLIVVVKDNELTMEHCKTLGEWIRLSTSLRHFTLSQYQSLQATVDMLEPIVTAVGQNTSLESFSLPNDGLFLLAALTALMRTGRAREVQMPNVRFDDKDETLFLSKDFTHRKNTTAKYLSPAKIRSVYIDGIPCRYVGDTSFLSDLHTLSNLVIKDCDLSKNDIKGITEGFLVRCKGIDSKTSDEEARSLVDVEGGSGIEQSNKTCTLEHIELTNCRIGPVGAQHLAQALCVNTSVKTLKLSCNHLHDEGAIVLAEMLGGNRAESSGTVTLEHVDLSSCRIRPAGAQRLAQALRVNNSVKTLKLSCNAVGDEGAKALAKMLKTKNSRTVYTSLEHIDLYNCSIEPVGTQHLAQALRVNTSVKTLKLSCNHLRDKGARALAEMLGGKRAESSGTVNTTLEHVYLRNCYIGPIGAKRLAQALCVNNSVKTLKLSGNAVGDEGAKVLAKMLKRKNSRAVYTTLEHIDLSDCRIGPAGAQYLAQALRVNTSVKTLKLFNNPLDDEGAKALAELLGGYGSKSSGTVNTTLEHIDLRNCSIGPEGAQHLAQALCVNTSVKTLKFLKQNQLINWRDIEEILTKQQKERIEHRCI